MDATALSPEESRELAALRRRAYGPRPDIAADPVAVARLEALEALLHRAGAMPAPVPAPTASAPSSPRRDRPKVVGTLADAPADDIGDTGAASEGTGARPRRVPPGFGRVRKPWLVAVLAVALTAALVWGVSQLSAPGSDMSLGRIPAGQDAERLARQGFLDAADVTADEVQRFEAYEALQIWLVVAASGERCLVIEAERYGILGVNCTPRGLDPTIDLRIWRGMRANVFGDLPPNTFLRFSHHSDRVHVWIRPPSGES